MLRTPSPSNIGHVTLPPNSYDLEMFRNRWIKNVDKSFLEDIKELREPGSLKITESINSSPGDDQEVAKIKSEFDRMQKKLAYFEKESRKREFFEYLPTNTCTSHQFIFVRNQRLVTSLNDVEILFLRDSDEESIFTDIPSCSMSRLHYTENPFIMTESCKSRMNQSLLFKLKRLLSCWY